MDGAAVIGGLQTAGQPAAGCETESRLGELEAKAKAGEQISLTDLAAAVKAEEKAPKAKKFRAAKPKKPSIRAQLDAAKKEQRKQTQPREKSKELEV